MFCRHAYNCIMPGRKKSRRGDNLQKLNSVHPKVLREVEGARHKLLHYYRLQPCNLPAAFVVCAESEDEDDAAQSEPESEDEEVQDNIAAGKKRKQRARAARKAAEIAAHCRIDSFFKPPTATAATAPSAAGASRAQTPSLGSPAGCSPAGSSAAPAAPAAPATSSGQPGAAHADFFNKPPAASSAPSAAGASHAQIASPSLGSPAGCSHGGPGVPPGTLESQSIYLSELWISNKDQHQQQISSESGSYTAPSG